MLKLRIYTVQCPCCEHPIDIPPPQSLAAEGDGLTHRCTWCRRLLLTSVSQLGPWRMPKTRVIAASDRYMNLTPAAVAEHAAVKHVANPGKL